jgi:hypothetical protein
MFAGGGQARRARQLRDVVDLVLIVGQRSMAAGGAGMLLSNSWSSRSRTVAGGRPALRAPQLQGGCASAAAGANNVIGMWDVPMRATARSP